MKQWVAALAITAGLFGAAGVALAAAGAHLTTTPIVTTAAYFLLFHAAALVGLSVSAAVTTRPLGLCVGASAIVIGTILFSGDLATRGLAGVILIHMAAPTGGVILMVGWLVVAATLPRVIQTLRFAS